MNKESNSRYSGTLLGLLPLLVYAPLVPAQTQAPAPVEERRPNQEETLRGQQAAETAYRDLQQAERVRVQAEQESQRAAADYAAAQKRADELKRTADTMTRNLDAAKATETQVRKSYDAAVNAVDQRWQKPAPR